MWVASALRGSGQRRSQVVRRRRDLINTPPRARDLYASARALPNGGVFELLQEGFLRIDFPIESTNHYYYAVLHKLLVAPASSPGFLRWAGLPTLSQTTTALISAELTSSDAVSERKSFRELFGLWVGTALEGRDTFFNHLWLLLESTDVADIPQVLRGLLSLEFCASSWLLLCSKRFLHLSRRSVSCSHIGHTLVLRVLAESKRAPRLFTEELCVSMLSCLRYAPWFTLRRAYQTLAGISLCCTSDVAAKFLGCAAFACHITHSLDDSEGGVSLVRQATALALQTPSMRQSALYNTCVVYGALGSQTGVFSLYQHDVLLNPTRALVECHARAGNLQQALLTLYEMATSYANSRSEVPSTVLATCMEVARLIGERGHPESVHDLVRTVNRFRSPVVVPVRFLESVLRGACQRVTNLPSVQRYESLRTAAIADVSRLVEIVLRYATPSMNRGPLHALIAACLKVQLAEVPLLCGVVRGAVAGASSSGTSGGLSAALVANSMLWVQRSAIALARDAGRLGLAGELCAAWGLPPLASQPNQRLASTVLWRCPSCNVPNSDRFSACGGCGALRSALTCCTSCLHVQETSNTSCVVCSAKVSSDAKDLIVMKPWKCESCQKTNEPSRPLRCAFCKNPRQGDVAKRMNSEGSTSSKNCSRCNAPKFSDKQPYCLACGAKSSHFSNTESHYFWQCGQCQQWVPSLEFTCTSCCIGEKSNGCSTRKWEDTQKCPSCNSLCNSLAAQCPSCAASLLSADHTSVPVAAMCCLTCNTISLSTAQESCLSCGAASFGAVERIVVRDRRCPQCSNDISKMNATALCPRCCAVLPHIEWSVSVLAASLKALAHSDAAVHGVVSGLEFLLRALEARNPWHDKGKGSGSGMDQVVVVIAAIQSRLGPASLLQRRALALCRKLMFLLVPKAMAEEQEKNGSQQKVCPECLGSHDILFCPFSGKPWHCLPCGAANTNERHNRYFCASCFAPRPEFSSANVTETWECKSCRYLVVDMDSYCARCGVARCGDETVLPLAPAVCGQCETLHLEPTCRACPKQSLLHDGIVCTITNWYALIRPAAPLGSHSTDSEEQRVLVREDLFELISSRLHEHQLVKYAYVIKEGQRLATKVDFGK